MSLFSDKAFYRKHNRPHWVVTFDFLVELPELMQKDIDFWLLLKAEEQHGSHLVG